MPISLFLCILTWSVSDGLQEYEKTDEIEINLKKWIYAKTKSNMAFSLARMQTNSSGKCFVIGW